MNIISKIYNIFSDLILIIRVYFLYSKYEKYTMVPVKYFVFNIVLAYRFRKISGDIVEREVWRVGMIAGISEIISCKKAFLFDSFEGLPVAKSIDGLKAREWQNNPGGQYYYNNCTAEKITLMLL